MLATLLFAAYAIVALAAGVLVIAARRVQTAVEALCIALLAMTCAYVQVAAPVVAATHLVLLAGAAIAALRLAVSDEPAERLGWRRLAALVPVAGLALVLVSTWARQYVWTGRELPPGTRLGAAATIGQAWGELYAPALGAALLALLVAAIAGLATREHRL